MSDVMFQGFDNGFGLCMSSCPKLEKIHTYKFRMLSGENCLSLPNCTSLSLHRSECTESIQILHAPKLVDLNLQAAYEMKTVRVWDGAAVPQSELNRIWRVVSDTDERLAAEKPKMDVEIQKWKSGVYMADDAVRERLVKPERRDRWDPNSAAGDRAINRHCFKEMMHINERADRESGRAWNAIVTASKSVAPKSRDLPRCKVNLINAIGISRSSATMTHLRGNPRVDVELEDPDMPSGGRRGGGGMMEGFWAMFRGGRAGGSESESDVEEEDEDGVDGEDEFDDEDEDEFDEDEDSDGIDSEEEEEEEGDEDEAEEEQEG
uniref:Uncharacterized protein n=1 Tax=Chromera velia CCMP2878 TaxID=1169474 RepID=A0A0G4HEH0_9ALVE|eukprot:Cvel_26608.t1-p1 / transcript=Cvel_26608.t1 / gene=Cvel_26608 / organism=Chromera_velia_CCMP2878 / gene_product=hypothetical protein / transcript_product=hypothetical protein / location=Cvel_scaffold3191:7051-9571(+) / protein_length=320 / sequence_SO=supercontig / SO=protein_coding / is_pseudo=false